jgi:serine/threonine protein phosphatase PrpC
MHPKNIHIQSIADPDYMNQPEKDFHNTKLSHIHTESVEAFGQTTYGGPGSKYKRINEDSYLMGYNGNSFYAGVIDGSGNSTDGYLASKIVNDSLMNTLTNQASLNTAVMTADEQVRHELTGGYATGALVQLDDKTNKLEMASKGDTKIITFRDGKLFLEGCSPVQSVVGEEILSGNLPPCSLHTHPRKNIITGSFGAGNKETFTTDFQTKAGDQVFIFSDGVGDVVSDYEIGELAQEFSGEKLHRKIFELAFDRNNSNHHFAVRTDQGAAITSHSFLSLSNEFKEFLKPCGPALPQQDFVPHRLKPFHNASWPSVYHRISNESFLTNKRS